MWTSGRGTFQEEWITKGSKEAMPNTSKAVSSRKRVQARSESDWEETERERESKRGNVGRNEVRDERRQEAGG